VSRALLPLPYLHLDVFAPRAYAGNSLAVFLQSDGLDTAQMQAITRELRHFEATFLIPASAPGRFRARVFDLFEELPFAGHPIVGAAVALHHADGDAADRTWTLDLTERTVTVATHRIGDGYSASLDQGEAKFLSERSNREEIASAFGLTPADLDRDRPVAVVSTGLRYLIVPVRSAALARAHIASDITGLVTDAGAQYAVLLDEAGLEIRHWNNDGVIEDVATGSAAGTIGAYRLRYGGARSGAAFILNQGRFAGRPSQIEVEPHGTREAVHSVKVGGKVAIVGRGQLEVLP